MKRFRHILFVADKSRGEQHALVNILELARHFGTRVTVIDVMTVYPDKFFIPDASVDLVSLHQQTVEDRLGQLQTLATSAARQAGAAVPDIVMRDGADHIEIIRQVKSGNHDLVCKASDNNTLVTGALFGTLDMHLLRKCPCPVFIVKPKKKIRHANVLAAVDLDYSTKPRSALNRLIVDLAASLAGMEEGNLDLLHAWHLPYERKMRSDDLLRDTNTVDALLRDMKKHKQQQLNALAETWSALQPRTHLVRGEADTVIPKFASRKNIDLVVMGTVGRGGIAGFFIGNTAEKVLYALNCSVLAIKPAGFKTPVR